MANITNIPPDPHQSSSETYANYFGRSPYERIKLRQLDLSKLPIEGLTQLECGGQGADVFDGATGARRRRRRTR